MFTTVIFYDVCNDEVPLCCAFILNYFDGT